VAKSKEKLDEQNTFLTIHQNMGDGLVVSDEKENSFI
jgi:hypothetical protein